jgi:drug/metabolite transporter (DMT)-like permease
VNAERGVDPKATRARAGAFLAIVLWGVSFVATKAALREANPITVVFLRVSIGAFFLFLLLAARGERLLPPASTLRMLVVMGAIGVGVHQMIQAIALRLTTAINTGWLIALTPIWSAIIARIFRNERLDRTRLLGLFGGFAGALVLVSRGRFSADVWALPGTKGDFLIVLSTLNWAIFSNLGQSTLRRLGPLRATAFVLAAGWLLLLPWFIRERGWTALDSLTIVGSGSIVFLGLGCSGLGYLLWYGALERVEVARVASFLYIEPLVTLIAAMLILGEPAHPSALLGGALVLASVYVLQK